MPKAVVIRRDQFEPQNTWCGAFAEGLQRHGWTIETATAWRPCDLFVCWGVRRIHDFERQKGRGDICVLERSYIPDRFKWTSVSFGGQLNGRAEFRGPRSDPSRWERHFAQHMRPWRTDGTYALIMEQIPSDAACAGVNLERFYQEARHAFQGLMPVKLRRHPNVNPKHGERAIAEARASLEHDLAGARCVITWNSNSAVDAVLAGVPAVAMDRGSMAWDVTGHALALPPAPPREAWAHALAWCQWTKEEMASGECWAAVGRQAQDRVEQKPVSVDTNRTAAA